MFMELPSRLPTNIIAIAASPAAEKVTVINPENMRMRINRTTSPAKT
jgi:hypothetical protein